MPSLVPFMQNSRSDAPIIVVFSGNIIFGFEHILATTNKMLKVAQVRVAFIQLEHQAQTVHRLWVFE